MEFKYTDAVNAGTYSSNVDMLFYNENTEELVVEFLDNYRCYGYSGVPVTVWNALKNEAARREAGDTSFSVGRLYTREVKGVYKGFDAGTNSGDFVKVPVAPKVTAAAVKSQDTEELSFFDVTIAATYRVRAKDILSAQRQVTQGQVPEEEPTDVSITASRV